MFSFAFKTPPLAPDLQVSMGPSPHLWFLHAKQLLWDQNYKSLLGTDLTYRFVHAQSVISTRITSLHETQTSPVVLCMQNSVISNRITSLNGSHTSPVVLCMQNNVISIRITSLYGSQPLSVVFARKTATFASELQVSIGPRLHLLICACKRACLDPE